jgi:hypothetical protein
MDLSSTVELLRSELGDLAVLTDSPLSPVGRFDLQEAIRSATRP